MESEFLLGLGYQLGVRHSDFSKWSKLLDGFMLARAHDVSQAQRGRAMWSTNYPSPLLYTPATMPQATLPQLDLSQMYVTRSADPYWQSVDCDESYAPSIIRSQPLQHISPTSTRKRVAADAFTPDYPVDHEQQPIPYRRLQAGHPDTTGSRQPRSSSLNRRSGRQLEDSGRRGSAGHVYPVLPDIQTVMPDWQQMGDPGFTEYSTLAAPHEQYPPHANVASEVSIILVDLRGHTNDRRD